MSEVYGGIVKSYDDAKGYGYITPYDGSPDIIVHAQEIEVITCQSHL